MRVLIAVLMVLAVALAGCNSNKDTDGDGIPDRIENAGWQLAVYGMERSEVRQVFSDPEKADTDGDGFSDYEEWFRPIQGSLDPSSADTDGDGLTDCQEVLHTVIAQCEDPDYNGPYDGGYGTDPLAADSDTSGVSRVTNRFLNEGRGYIDDVGHRTSNGVYLFGDGISDYDEIMGYDVELGNGVVLRHVRTDPLSLDSDGDGLEDGEERMFGGNPLAPDTDNDGCADGVDPHPANSYRYGLNFGQFHLKQSQDVGGANLVMQAVVAETAGFYPGEGSLRVTAGESTDISSLSTGPHAPPGCGTSLWTPWNPWLFVQVVATHKSPSASYENDNADGLQWLDINPDTGDDVRMFDLEFVWNVRDGTLHDEIPRDSEGNLPYNLDGTASGTALEVDAQGYLRTEGNDAWLTVRPTLI